MSAESNGRVETDVEEQRLDVDHTEVHAPVVEDPVEAGDAEAGASLIVVSHPLHGRLGTRYRLPPESSVEIGRDDGVDISLDGVSSVSRRHARLAWSDGRFSVEDLHSTNGTFLNERPVKQREPLASGDRLQIGAVHFKFLHELDVEAAYHEALFQLAIRDGLTGVFNKRRFTEELEREIARNVRHGRPLALVLFDIDKFKRINDSFGHMCGDLVLQEIAHACQRALRAEQTMARVGGEEFAVLCPETDGPGAATLAEKLRRMIAGRYFVHERARFSVTCSFGVAELGGEIRTPDELYTAADQALYLSKNLGRDRVTLKDTSEN